MKTRIAQYQDVMRVVRYLRKTHAMTGWDWVPFDEKRVRNMVTYLVRTRGSDVIMAVNDAKQIKGALLAQTDLFFWSGKAKYASSVHTVGTGGGLHCLRRFIKWADDEGCDCIVESVATDIARAEKVYERLGFKRQGNALVYRFNEEQEEAA